MIMFFAFMFCALLELWPLLMMWGFSAGPVNIAPFLVLVGCFLMMFLAAPLSLFIRRVGALIGLVASTLILAWPVAVAAMESDLSALILAVPPAVAAGVAIRGLLRARGTRWLARVSTPDVWVRVAMSALPFILFCTLFNARLVVALLLAGPPR